MTVTCVGGPCDGRKVDIEDGVTEFVCPRLEPATEPLPAIGDPLPKVLHLYRVVAPGRAEYVGLT